MKTVQEYIDKLQKAYNEAHYPIEKDGRIERGRSRSVSGVVEDLTAWLILQELSDHRDIKVLVDQPITMGRPGMKKTVYPDISVCKVENGQYKCVYMCDIKTDPGWIRNRLPDLIKKHNEEMRNLRGPSGENPKNVENKTTYIGRGKTKEQIDISFADCHHYDIVCVTAQNGGRRFASIKDNANQNNYTVNVFVLLEGEHPNAPIKKKNNPPKASAEYKDWINRIREEL